MDALDVRVLGERFDVVLWLDVLHRVTDPIALLGALVDVLAPVARSCWRPTARALAATSRRSRFTRYTRAMSSSIGAYRRGGCADVASLTSRS
jgi:hypothetical protein